jgi:hypothetical protein
VTTGRGGLSAAERGYRYGWLILVVVVLVIVVIIWLLTRSSPGPGGTYGAAHPIQCSTDDSESCYYVNSNKPVSPNPQSVSYNGMTVATVGLLPPNCSTYNACTYLGNVGVWQVWDTNPKGTSHLEATYGAPPSGSTGNTPPSGSTGNTGGTGSTASIPSCGFPGCNETGSTTSSSSPVCSTTTTVAGVPPVYEPGCPY